MWNIGEPPVEGYSNFSFVVLARLAIALGINPAYFLKSLGVLGLFFTSTAIYRLSRFWFSPLMALIPVIWLLAYRGEMIWSVSGLETTVYQALLAYAVVFLLKGLKSSPQHMAFAAFLLAIASLTRPEAPILMAIFMVFAWFLDQSDSRAGLKMFVSIFMLCFVPYFLWRWHYFGRLFPNPVYCKGLTEGYDFTLIKQYLTLAWPFMALAVPAIWFSHDKRHYFLWLPSIVYGVLLIGASPLVAFDNRLFLPAFALLLPLSLQGLQSVWVYVLKRQDQGIDIAVYGAALLLLYFCIPTLSLSGFRHFSQNPQAGERLRLQVTDWLVKNTDPASPVVLADCGLIPYLSPHRFIDSYCLNNAEMTLGLRSNMYHHFCNQMMLIKPNVIILTALIQGEKITYSPADQCMSLRLKKHSQYQLKAQFSTGSKGVFYRYEIYQKASDL